jgi:hypothetical protein
LRWCERAKLPELLKQHDTRAIQDWLGHRSIQHTVRYTELAPTRFKDFWREWRKIRDTVGAGTVVTLTGRTNHRTWDAGGLSQSDRAASLIHVLKTTPHSPTAAR